MLKLISLVLGLAVGFGVGIWWGQHNPTAAGALSAAEETKFLKVQASLTKSLKEKLDQIQSRQAAGPVSGSGFLGGAAPAVSSSDIKDLDQKADEQLKQLNDRVSSLSH